MPIQVKRYTRKTKKGVTVVNAFYRKGDKKKQDNNVAKLGTIAAVGLGAGALLTGSILLKKKNINIKPPVNVVKPPSRTVSNKAFDILPDPWETSAATAKSIHVNLETPVKSTQKLLPPNKAQVPTLSEIPKINIDGKTYEGVRRAHGKLRVVHKGETIWDTKLIKDKNVLDLAKSTGSGSISDRQRAVEIFKKEQQTRDLYRKTLQKAKRVSLRAEKVVDKATKKKVTVNVKQNLDNLVEEFNKTKSKTVGNKASSISARITNALKTAKDKAEGATVKRVKGTRRDFLTGFVNKIDTSPVPSTNDIKAVIKKEYNKAKKLADGNKETIDGFKKTVKEQLDLANTKQQQLKDTVKKRIANNNPLSSLENLAPQNETIQNLIKSGKKEAKKTAEVQALSKVNPLLGKIQHVKEDIKSRVDQLNRYSDELEATGDKALNRRQLLKNTGKKIAKEASKKPKDAYYATKGTVNKTRVVLRNKAGNVEQNITTAQEMGGRFYGVKGDLGVYRRVTGQGYRPNKGLLRRLSRSGNKYMKWKSGNLE